jgi:hypothetical protein
VVRRRPVGAVIADICRDLGILPSHPLWRELSEAIIRLGGSLAAWSRTSSGDCSHCLPEPVAPARPPHSRRRFHHPRPPPAPAHPDPCPGGLPRGSTREQSGAR